MRWIFFCLLFVGPVLGQGFANGVKIGEVDGDSAIVWARLTEKAQQDPYNKAEGGAVPGQAGEMRIHYWKQGVKNKALVIDWGKVSSQEDFTRHFQLKNLNTNTRYAFEVFGRVNAEGKEVKISGVFQTAPEAKDDRKIQFLVSTCQRFQEMDDVENGHRIYQSMGQHNADFFVQTGDAVYYDKPPFADDLSKARFKWNRIYALPNFRKFHRNIPSYWLKDDHDTLKNDSWPGQSYGELTWEQGLQVWREQVPMSPKPYRTFRWGKHVQVWFPEGREFRSPNTMKDGPEKTILGKEQWQWLRKTMAESDATYRIFVSATPVVGPDRGKKNDNHANAGFKHEGDQLRQFLASQPGCFVICGDRHWQYHSVDPQTGLKEFGTGPASNAHAQGFRKKDAVPWQKFLRIKGGFLSVQVEAGKNPPAVIRHHDVVGEVVSETVIQR